MKTIQLFRGSLSFSSNGNYAGKPAYRGQLQVSRTQSLPQAKRQLSFEEMLLHEFGAKPVAKAGVSVKPPQTTDLAASLDARASQSLWEFWA